MPRFAQLVVGPPGSGKTTYCHGMAQYLRALGRKVAVVNLDPANDAPPYDAAVDIERLVTLGAVMDEFGLGPNGGLMFCIEYLEKNLDWLVQQLAQFPGHYFIIDCPGQAELYSHHESMRRIVAQLAKHDLRVAAVNLIDAHHCADPAKYIAALVLSLQTMLKLELPHVNVLSKADLVEQFGRLAYDLEFYATVMDLSHLQRLLDADHFGRRYRGLNKALCELVEDFNLVSFLPLNIEDKDNVRDVLRVIDRANGYLYGDLDEPKAAYMGPGASSSAPAGLADGLEITEHYRELARSGEVDVSDDDDDDNDEDDEDDEDDDEDEREGGV